MSFNHVLSISGGKDSTAMMLEMLERGESIHSAVFFDTGWEFPAMYPHIDKLEKYTGIKIWRLHPNIPFDHWMTARHIKRKTGNDKGQFYRIGEGWPSPMRRWCTRIKVDAINKYSKTVPNPIQCIGYAADEADRKFYDKEFKKQFPLIRYGITEADALKICYRHGFDWDGLYEHFGRVSCFCCPLKSLKELRTLRKHFPGLWKRMLEMERNIVPFEGRRGFKDWKSVADLDRRFAEEDRQMPIWALKMGDEK